MGVIDNDDDRLIVEDGLSLPVGDCEGVGAAVPVPDPVPVTVDDGVALALRVVLPVPESDPVFEALAPEVSDAVGV